MHDRNVSLNKEIERHRIKNQNDLWHGIKNLKKSVKNVCSGPKYKHGSSWHHELDDKGESVANHAHYAARNCNVVHKS